MILIKYVTKSITYNDQAHMPYSSTGVLTPVKELGLEDGHSMQGQGKPLDRNHWQTKNVQHPIEVDVTL